MSISLNAGGSNTQWLDLGAVGELNDQTRATFVAWIRPRSAGPILADDGASYAFALMYGGAGVLAVLMYNPGTGLFRIWQRLDTPGIAIGTWASVVVSVDLTQAVEDQKLRVYVNGTDVTDGGAFAGGGGGYPGTFASTANPRRVGRLGASYFDGCIGQTAIYVGTARSAAEAAQIHALGITGPLDEIALPRHWYKLAAAFEDSGSTPIAATPNGGIAFGCPEGEPADGGGGDPDPEPVAVSDLLAVGSRHLLRRSLSAHVAASGTLGRRNGIASVAKPATGVYRLEPVVGEARDFGEHTPSITVFAAEAARLARITRDGSALEVRTEDADGAPADASFSLLIR